MILADTSVVIAYERTPTLRLRTLIAVHSAAVCGVSVAELFAGCRSPTDWQRSSAILADFQSMPIPDVLWGVIGRHHSALRAAGVTVQMTDTIIATVAIANGLELWTYDAHFVRIAAVLPALRLFQEPP
jgi:predicted nucleic acid-binding protein